MTPFCNWKIIFFHCQYFFFLFQEVHILVQNSTDICNVQIYLLNRIPDILREIRL